MDREVDDWIGGRLKVDAFLGALGQECGVDHGGFVQMRTYGCTSVLRAIFTQEATCDVTAAALPVQGGYRTVLPSISRCHADDQQQQQAASSSSKQQQAAASSSKQQQAAASSSSKQQAASSKQQAASSKQQAAKSKQQKATVSPKNGIH